MNSLKWMIIFMTIIVSMVVGEDRHIPDSGSLKASILSAQAFDVHNETVTMEWKVHRHCYEEPTRNQSTFDVIEGILKTLNDSRKLSMWIPLSVDMAICVVDQLFLKQDYYVEYDFDTQQILLDLKKDTQRGSKFIIRKMWDEYSRKYSVQQIPFCVDKGYCSKTEKYPIYTRYYFKFKDAFDAVLPPYEEAKTAYEEALKVKPTDQHAKGRIDHINKLAGTK